MTKVRRLGFVVAGLAFIAVLESANLWGEAPQKGSKLPPDSVRAANDEEAALARSKFEQANLVTYQTLKGEMLFALQLKLDLEAGQRRPRDLVLVINNSASQAGISWAAARQLAEQILSQASADDRVAVWTVSTPEKKFTRKLTPGFISPKTDTAKVKNALDELNNQYPAGDTDLQNGLQQALETFEGSPNRQQVILFLGDGLSTHSPLTSGDRQKLAQKMVEKRVTFFPIPLGTQLSPENLHGLATGTGGTVVRVQLLQDKAEEALKYLESALNAPVLYPETVQLPAEVLESYPSKLPPLRGDAPTLIVGKLKDAKTLKVVVEGTVAGKAERVTRTITEKVTAPELDNYFLVSMAEQWKKAVDQHALIRADRALVSAYENTRLKKIDLLLGGQEAVWQNEFDTAQQLFNQAKQIAPHDVEANAWLSVVAKLKSKELTREMLRGQIEMFPGGAKKITKDQIVRVSQAEVDKLKEAKPQGLETSLPPKQVDSILQAHKDRVVVEEQKTTQAVDAALAQARKQLSTDPEGARDLLRSVFSLVREHPDLGGAYRENLLRRLETGLRDVTMQGKEVILRRAQDVELKNMADRIDERYLQKKAEEDRTEAQFRIYKGLMYQARTDRHTEEKVLAGLREMYLDAEARGQQPPPATQAAYAIVSASYNLEVQRELRRKRELGFLAVMLEVEKSHVPFADEPPIHFPPLVTWQALYKMRKERYEVTSLPDDPVARMESQRVSKMLEEVIDTKDFYQAGERTLEEILGLFSDKLSDRKMELPILVDTEAFKEENPDAPDPLKTTIKWPQYPKRMALQMALKLALSKVPTNNATFLIRRNYIEVTTIERQTRERVLRVYPVGDLVIPISSPVNPFMNQGIGSFQGGGGFQGGFGGGGFQGGFGGGGFSGGFGGGGYPGSFGGGGFGGGYPGSFGGGGFGGGGYPGSFGGGGMMYGGGGMMYGGGGMMYGGGGFGQQIGGMPGQNCLGFNQANGGLGFQGSTMDQGLILLIQQVVAPGEWGAMRCQTQPSFGFGAGYPGMQFGGGGFPGAQFGGFPGAQFGGFPGANAGGFPGAAVGGLGGGPTVPTAEGGPAADIRNANTIGFYAPALALVVRGTSNVHYKYGGVTGPKKTPGVMGAQGELPPGKIFIAGTKNQGEEGGVKVAGTKDQGDEPDPKKVWQEALARGVENPGIIIATADFLFENEHYDHAVEFLKANLRLGIVVRPWVYEALAVALEANEGDLSEIQRARLSAVALDPSDASGYLKAAVSLSASKQYGRALAFCKQAASLEPNLPHPYANALAYAAQGKDAEGMEWAVGKLLSQEWPVDSKELHLKAQQRLESLANTLTAEKRKDDADRLRAALRKLRERDLVIDLTWEGGASGPADLWLEVKEPGGTVCSSQLKMSPGGGTWIGNGLSQSDLTRVSYVASQAFSGEYQITVHRLWGQPLGGKAHLKIVQHQGTAKQKTTLETIVVDNSKSTTLKVKLADGRRTEVAVVPPPAAMEQQARVDTEPRPRVLEKLRDYADPLYTGGSTIRASGGTPGARQSDPSMPPAKRQADHLAYQTGVNDGSLNLTAQAKMSADQRELRLSLTPNFRNQATITGRPTVNLPLIPGGGNP